MRTAVLIAALTNTGRYVAVQICMGFFMYVLLFVFELSPLACFCAFAKLNAITGLHSAMLGTGWEPVMRLRRTTEAKALLTLVEAERTVVLLAAGDKDGWRDAWRTEMIPDAEHV